MVIWPLKVESLYLFFAVFNVKMLLFQSFSNDVFSSFISNRHFKDEVDKRGGDCCNQN